MVGYIHALKEAVVVIQKQCSCVWGTQSLAHVMQGLADLKDHNGWVVSRDDDLQVMYRHRAGVRGTYVTSHISSVFPLLAQASQRMQHLASALVHFMDNPAPYPVAQHCQPLCMSSSTWIYSSLAWAAKTKMMSRRAAQRRFLPQSLGSTKHVSRLLM